MQEDEEQNLIIQEKNKWKDRFDDQMIITKNSVNECYSKTKKSFKGLYATIPDALKDSQLVDDWENFDLNTNPASDKWWDLYTAFENWSYRHGYGATAIGGDPISELWWNIKSLAMAGDVDGLIELAQKNFGLVESLVNV